MRTVTGTLNYMIMGWSLKPGHIGFLMPITIVNLASLAIMVVVILRTTNGSYRSDPVSAKSLVLAEHHLEEGDPTGWKDYVTYHDRLSKVREIFRSLSMIPVLNICSS